MKREDLTPDQAKQLADALRPTMTFFHRLFMRMQKQGFPETDQLWLEVRDAFAALELLQFDLQRLSSGDTSWVGWVQRKEPSAPLLDLDSLSEVELRAAVADASERLAVLSYALELKQKAGVDPV